MTVHLHVRSAYTLMQSTNSISQLVQKAKQLDFSALALTDHHVLYGAMEFYHACQKAGIHAIIGMEFQAEENLNGVLLAKNQQGYQNLMRLSSLLNTSEQSLTLQDLAEFKQDCFLILYGEGGVFESALIHEKEFECCALLEQLKQQLGDYDVALSYQETSFWRLKNELLRKCCRQLNISCVALSKVYYTEQKDATSYKIMRAIEQGKLLSDKTLKQDEGRYLRTHFEMEEIYLPEELKRTDEIARQCNVKLDEVRTTLPHYQNDKNSDSGQYLAQLCLVGLKKRLQGVMNPVYSRRLKYELDIILQLHFEDYFLIVYDFIRYAKSQGIYVGPGRGSAAGSLVAYCLGITNIDPIHYNLLFERFLNPERVSMPDIDTDFPDNRREEVIRYVVERYGKDHVAHIITFGTFGSKLVLRDVGKVMGLTQREVDILAKAVPNGVKVTLEDAYRQSPRFRSLIEADSRYRQCFEMSLKLEGLPKYIGTHAAGVVMSQRSLKEVLPLVQVEQGMVSTQYPMNYLEEIGLIKMDFLGLRNLTIIDDICHKISEQFDIYKIPLDDAKTYRLIANADTVGIFQLESDGMKDLLKKIQPTRFEDIVVAIALYRPGPMKNIPLYLQARQNPHSMQALHPEMEPILKDTYGIMIYQEQVMQVAQVMAGFSLAKADLLRKAISKKNEAELQSYQQQFIDGCVQRGMDSGQAQRLYGQIMEFAQFGFNKSHSVAYALVAYQLAYLKANVPTPFYCALLNSVLGSEVKTSQYIFECRRKKVTILPVSVNESGLEYTMQDHQIRFPLTAVKGVGMNVAQAILQERTQGRFEDFWNFVARMNRAKVNRRTIETLIDAGALDEFKMNRKSMNASLDEAIRYAGLVSIEKQGQISYNFDLVSKPLLVSVHEDVLERSEREKAALGFYLSSHPILQLKKKLQIECEPLVVLKQKYGFIEGFIYISRIKTHRTKKGDMMAFGLGVDESDEMEMVLMPNVYRQYHELWVKGNYCWFSGKLDEQRKCLVNKLRNVRVQDEPNFNSR